MESASSSSVPDAATACLSDDDTAALLTGEIAAEQRRWATDHMDFCEDCRRRVSALIAARATSTDAAESGSDTELRAGLSLGRFALIRLLGRGSMGEVWAAHDQALDRDVALKLLRLGAGMPAAEAALRLRREAQAMARLNHPNIVSIYEIDSDDDDRVFCAMELVDGVTLRRWLETPRPWRDVYEMAIAVARGIDTAHAVGVIHRDIKPENVLIASSGRAVISDFGLAKLADFGTGVEPVPPTCAPPSSATGALTATGALVGTPIYMAPEQLAGNPASAESDQFSYCVMIHEALFGARPFAGNTLDELVQKIRQGLPHAGRPGGAPGRIARCLERGLAADPMARWPSMTALADALERAVRGRQRRRRIAALIAGAAAATLVAAVVASRGPDPREVARAAAEQRIAIAWNPVKATLLQARFFASGTPLASERAATTIRLLDAYRASWAAQRLDAWSATHVRHDQTPELLERRLSCYDQLADAIDGLVGLFLMASAREVNDAPEIVYRLEPVATCGNIDRLLARPPAPSTTAARDTDRQLRELQLVQLAGRYAESLQRASSLVDTATRLGEPALLARALYRFGAAQASAGQLVAAEATLRRAVQDAAAARDHALVAECWMRLLSLTGFELLHADVAAAIEPAAIAAVAQAGNDPRQRADLAKTQGLLAIARGDRATAYTRFVEARDRHVAARGASDPAVANDESNLGGILIEQRRYDEASAHIERAIAIVRGTLGEHHPVLAQAEHNLATIASDRENWAEAERHARAGIAMNIAVRGGDHPDTNTDRINLARILREQKRFGDARAELEHARVSYARSLPQGHPSVIMLDVYVAQVAAAEGRWDQAVTLARQVVAAAERENLPAIRKLYAYLVLARMVAHTAPRDALPIYDDALRLRLGIQGTAVRDGVALLQELAEVALAAHRPAAATAWFDRMPETAAQLVDVRRRLDAAARHR